MHRASETVSHRAVTNTVEFSNSPNGKHHTDHSHTKYRYQSTGTGKVPVIGTFTGTGTSTGTGIFTNSGILVVPVPTNQFSSFSGIRYRYY